MDFDPKNYFHAILVLFLDPTQTEGTPDFQAFFKEGILKTRPFSQVVNGKLKEWNELLEEDAFSDIPEEWRDAIRVALLAVDAERIRQDEEEDNEGKEVEFDFNPVISDPLEAKVPDVADDLYTDARFRDGVRAYAAARKLLLVVDENDDERKGWGDLGENEKPEVNLKDIEVLAGTGSTAEELRQEMEDRPPSIEDTPPEGRRERPERITTAAAGKSNYTRVELSEPPPPDPDVLRIQAVTTAVAEEKAVLRAVDAEVSVVVRDALLLALGEAKTVADCVAFSNAWRHEGPCAALAFPHIPDEVKQHHGWATEADLAHRLLNPVALGTPVLTPRHLREVSSKLNELWSKFKAQEKAAEAAKPASTA